MMPRLEGAACVDTAPADQLCTWCRARPECLAWALEHEEFGYWAGHTATALTRLRTEFGIQLDRIELR